MCMPPPWSFARESLKRLMGRRLDATAKTVWMRTIQMAHASRSWSSLRSRNHAAILIQRTIRSRDRFRRWVEQLRHSRDCDRGRVKPVFRSQGRSVKAILVVALAETTLSVGWTWIEHAY